MPLTMRHPYFGYLVVCAELDGEQHEREEPEHQLYVDRCRRCEYPMLACLDEGLFVTCCPCGFAHGIECEWPL